MPEILTKTTCPVEMSILGTTGSSLLKKKKKIFKFSIQKLNFLNNLSTIFKGGEYQDFWRTSDHIHSEDIFKLFHHFPSMSQVRFCKCYRIRGGVLSFIWTLSYQEYLGVLPLPSPFSFSPCCKGVVFTGALSQPWVALSWRHNSWTKWRWDTCINKRWKLERISKCSVKLGFI